MGKHVGKWITLAAIAGAAAAGISYLAKYKSFHKELEEDFHDFEDEDDDSAAEASESMASKRKYVSLSSDKDEFVVAAKDMMNAAKDMMKDTSSIVSDTYRDMASIAKDSAMTTKDKVSAAKDRVHEKVSEKKDEWKEKFYTKKKADENDNDMAIDDLDDEFDFSDDILDSPVETAGNSSVGDSSTSPQDILSQDAQDLAGTVADSTKLDREDTAANEKENITATITEES